MLAPRAPLMPNSRVDRPQHNTRTSMRLPSEVKTPAYGKATRHPPISPFLARQDGAHADRAQTSAQPVKHAAMTTTRLGSWGLNSRTAPTPP
jgi:hypothetical protein